MGVGSLVLGIISIVIGLFFNFMGWLGALLGIIGIILGALGRKSVEGKGIATAGLVCSIIGTLLSLLLYLLCIAILGSAASMF